MAILSSDKTLLNNFPKTQPALQRTSSTLPPDSSGIPLGDMINEASGAGSKSASWSFAANGGAGTTTIVLAKDAIPAGAIISTVILEVKTAITGDSTPTATIQLATNAGATPVGIVAAIPNADLIATGFKNYMAIPMRANSAIDSICIRFSAAVTAGAVNVFVSYLNP